MIFKMKTKAVVLFFAFFPLISILWAYELGVPLPQGSVKILERSSNFGPIKSFTEAYKISLTKARVLSFYKKAMAEAGWKQKQDGVFIKDKYIAVVVCSSLKSKTGEIEFTITVSNIPAKEEFLAMRKATPDKLTFMPIYPGSEQTFLLEFPFGMASAYETEGSVEEVAFFYKSGMLNYGWGLDHETSVRGGAVDCPGCQKLLSGSLGRPSKPEIASNTSKANLIFRKQNGETCAIEIANVSVNSGNLPVGTKSGGKNKPGLMSKTTIFANYHEYKITKP